ncbi:MAG: amidohydrolase family protein [Planctomycetes bacterium]|nr:amidohydrolase family protein [Planctomycetota bacterium]
MTCASRVVATFVAFSFLLTTLTAQMAGAPARRPDEGQGPFTKWVIRGPILIDGTGGPPRGPVDVVIEGNRIASVRSAYTPGTPPREDRPPRDAAFELDATGMYLLPGFVDMHAHGGGGKTPNIEYVYKLWLAHGVTTVRGVPLGPLDWVEREKARSARNEIVAPRIVNYQLSAETEDPEKARAWVREAHAKGVEGLKLRSYRPEVMAALLSEAKELGMGSVAHLAQTGVAQMNAIDAARLGLQSVTHFYGHFEALLAKHRVQPWPVDHNYEDEQQRFAQVARLWDQIHEPGGPAWKAYLQEHLKLGTVFDPTFNIYSANRDLMRARNAPWHDTYTLPSLWEYFEPNRNLHGSYWFYWTTEDEVAWRNFYQRWFRLVNDYKNLGGRVTTGSDSGFIYKTFGFGYIEELELLREAGFHPLEVIQAATMNGALTIHEPKGIPIEYGVVRPGLLADMFLVEENPLANLKVLYGHGAFKLDDETRRPTRVGGVRWTIKDGILYDAKQLLRDVAAMVEEQKKERGR